MCRNGGAQLVQLALRPDDERLRPRQHGGSLGADQPVGRQGCGTSAEDFKLRRIVPHGRLTVLDVVDISRVEELAKGSVRVKFKLNRRR